MVSIEVYLCALSIVIVMGIVIATDQAKMTGMIESASMSEMTMGKIMVMHPVAETWLAMRKLIHVSV